MEFILNWNDFIQRTASSNIYVKEEPDRWCCYAVIKGNEMISCYVKKSDNFEQNIMFVDKYLTSNPQVVKILGIKRGNNFNFIVEENIDYDENVQPIVDGYEVADDVEEVEEIQQSDEAVSNDI